jgi:hypothetical protein
MKGRLALLTALVVVSGVVIVLALSCGDDSSPDLERTDARNDSSGLCGHQSCPAPQECCDGVCTDVSTDTRNCGACGNACLVGPASDCVNSTCTCQANNRQPCPNGETCCPDKCTNTKTDPTNCGSCGAKCLASQTCTSGVCACGSVGACSGTDICCDDKCVDSNSNDNCGFCGNKCNGSTFCKNHVCTSGSNNCGPNGGLCPNGEICCPNICCPPGNCMGGTICQNGQDGGL